MWIRWVPLATALAVFASMGAPSTARACGGCFHPPPPPMGSPAPVSAHRMAVVLSPRSTTLWDQIVYEGNPEDFVWVLPISATMSVQLASNDFFEQLESLTRITMHAPARPRTSCPNPCNSFGGGLSGADFAAASDAGRAVTVHHEGVVGPYATATISSEDPDALVAWLRDNGYQVPDSILPIIAHYTAQRMSFAVLRLRPEVGIQRMQPVRVTMPGLSPTFPLRMVAAGIEQTVALELFVFAEGRIEAANYGNSEVDRAAITFDWATETFDYERQFELALHAGDSPETLWVTEYAGTEYWVQPGADWSVVQAGFDRLPYLTRLRTDMPASELDRDLVLQAATGGDIGTRIAVTRERNRPAEPVCLTACPSSDTRGPGSSGLRGVGATGGCSASPQSSSALGLLVLALLALRNRRR